MADDLIRLVPDEEEENRLRRRMNDAKESGEEGEEAEATGRAKRRGWEGKATRSWTRQGRQS